LHSVTPVPSKRFIDLLAGSACADAPAFIVLTPSRESHRVVPDLDFLVIETYPQLFGCLLAVAAAIAVVRLGWLRWRRAPAKLIVVPIRATARPDTALSLSEPQLKRRLNAGRQEFDRLAAYIDDASVRADHVSETQSKAAQKLDTVEVAVNRLLADMDGIMTVPRTSVSATRQGSASLISANAMPKAQPERAILAA
jgi:hypothetical protein